MSIKLLEAFGSTSFLHYRIKNARSNPLVHLRSIISRQSLHKVERKVLRTLNAWTRESAERVRGNFLPIPIDASTRWTEQLIEAQKDDLFKLGQAGRNQALRELGIPKQFDVEIGAEPIDAFLLDPVQVEITDWLEEVSSGSTQIHAEKINAVHQEGFAAGKTVRQIAQDITGLSQDFNKNRSNVIAHTNTNWAFNAGIKQQYRDIGVTVLEWLTSKDDRVCPFCLAMEGVRVRSEDPFWSAGEQMIIQDGEIERQLNFKFEVAHPPLHPRCGCTLIPVIEQITIPIIGE